MRRFMDTWCPCTLLLVRKICPLVGLLALSDYKSVFSVHFFFQCADFRHLDQLYSSNFTIYSVQHTDSKHLPNIHISTPPLPAVCSVVYSLTHSLACSLTHSLTHSLAHSLTNSFTHSQCECKYTRGWLSGYCRCLRCGRSWVRLHL